MSGDVFVTSEWFFDRHEKQTQNGYDLPKPPLFHRIVLYGFGAERFSSSVSDAGRM